MAQRFGRNRRRRARLELAAQVEAVGRLTTALNMDRALLKEYGHQVEQMRREIHDAKRIAGRMSVLFPATTMLAKGPARSSIQHEVQASGFSVEDTSMQKMQFPQQTLRVMLSKIQKDALTRAVHVRVQFDGGQWGYGISADARRSMPEDCLAREVINHLGEAIGSELVQTIQPGGQAR